MTFCADDEPIPSFFFSAAHYEGHDRFDAWQHEVAQLFDVAPVADTFASDGPSFEGSIGGYLIDGMLVAENHFSEQKYRRDRRLAARTGLDAYLVQLYTAGGFDGYADAAEIAVRAGDVCVFDMNDTLATQAIKSSAISLVIPKLLVDRHWKARAPVNGLVIPGGTALGHILGSHLSALGRAAPGVTVGEAPIVAEATARLTASCLAHYTGGDGLANGALQQALFKRAIHHIRGNLGAADLSPGTICRALNVSRPHLYRAFKDKGGVAHTILDQRLRLAFRELADPGNREETVSSIAFRCGFASDSHFTRLFRQTFGQRPTEVRDAPPLNVPSAKPSLPAWLSSPTFAPMEIR
ncbi:MAG TPA: AraC family transcriptional regulator [Alphaproteobacteria bacterium]|nr:AraC family transcriptional regulator [Alphaproteobacteria bacterium]